MPGMVAPGADRPTSGQLADQTQVDSRRFWRVSAARSLLARPGGSPSWSDLPADRYHSVAAQRGGPHREGLMAGSSFVNWDISFTIWWEPRNPNVIKMCTGDPRFVNDGGGRPGLWITFSSSRRSRYYNPAY